MICVDHEIRVYYRLHKNDNIASVSIDQILPNTDDVTLADLLASSENIEQTAINNETMQKFWHLVCTKKKLNKPITKKVAYLYFFKGYKYVEIARIVNVSRERVRQIVKYIVKIIESDFSQK